MLNFNLSIAQQIAVLALQLGVIIFAARWCGDLAKKAKMPSVLGELLAGIIIGPCLLGKIPLPFHGMEHGLFGFTDKVVISGDNIIGEAIISNISFQSYYSSLYAFATVGSIMLLFISGMETDLRMFIRYSLAGTLVGIGGVILSFVFGMGVGIFILDLPAMHPCSLFLGILCTATSVGITARILSEQKKIDTPEGVTTLAAAVIDDVLGIICLAVVTGIVASTGKGTDWGSIGWLSLKCVGFYLAASAIGLLIAGQTAKWLKKYQTATVYAALTFGLALLVSGLFEQQGLAMIIGAYVTGLSLSKTDIAFAVQRALQPLYNFLVPVFFVIMGMLVDISAFLKPEVLKIGLLYSLLAIVAKVLGCAIPALFMNFNTIGALRIGCGMIPRGEVALIIAGIGMTTLYDGEPVLNADLFGVAIIMTLVTTMISPPILSWILNFKGKGVRREEKDMQVLHTPFSFNSPILTEFILRHLIDNLAKEGYMFSQLDKESGVMQIRKDNLSFALTVSGQNITFESNPDEVPFIKTLMFETIIALHLEMEDLKKLAQPEDLRQDFFKEDNTAAPEAAHNHRNSILKTFRRDAIIMELQSSDKAGIFMELINLLAKNGAVADIQECFEAVMERESIVSTCLQNGIAMPHCRSKSVNRPALAIGFKHEGCCFDSLDGKPTRIFVLCVSPTDFRNPHIEALATVGTILNSPENLRDLLNSTTPGEVYQIFQRQ